VPNPSVLMKGEWQSSESRPRGLRLCSLQTPKPFFLYVVVEEKLAIFFGQIWFNSKYSLSLCLSVVFQIPSLIGDFDFNVRITRSELEEMCSDLFPRILMPIKSVLEEANFTVVSCVAIIMDFFFFFVSCLCLVCEYFFSLVFYCFQCCSQPFSCCCCCCLCCVCCCWCYYIYFCGNFLGVFSLLRISLLLVACLVIAFPKCNISLQFYIKLPMQDDVDMVELIGGSSRIPKVQSILKEFFKRCVFFCVPLVHCK